MEVGSSLEAHDPSTAPPQQEPKWTYGSTDVREKAKIRGLATRKGGRTKWSPPKVVQDPAPRPTSGPGSRGPRDPGIRRLSRAATLTQSRSMSSWLVGPRSTTPWTRGTRGSCPGGQHVHGGREGQVGRDEHGLLEGQDRDPETLGTVGPHRGVHTPDPRDPVPWDPGPGAAGLEQEETLGLRGPQPGRQGLQVPGNPVRACLEEEEEGSKGSPD